MSRALSLHPTSFLLGFVGFTAWLALMLALAFWLRFDAPVWGAL